MQRTATSQQELSPAQLHVLAALLEGRSVTDAAQGAGVDRTTVHRWLKDDFQFIAAFNRGRKQLRHDTEARLFNMANRATETVEQAIAEGNVSAALAVLKGLGLLAGTGPAIDSDDPQELREKAEIAHDNAVMMRAMSRM
jgi:hypothetical protein